MAFNKVERGPQTGAPPSVEHVAIDRLQVDPAYQRAADGPVSRKIIVGMVKEWKWPLCQPLVLARREDGSLWILDGQHRHAGAKERGDIPYLPCVIQPPIGAEAEARTFVDLNTKRQQLSQMDIFLGMLAAGDQYAQATAALLEETGWRVVRAKTTKHWKPGDLACAPAIARHLRVHGARSVREALLTLREAYPDDVVTATANLIQALVELYRTGSKYSEARPKITAAMARYSGDVWIPKAQNYRLDFPAASTRDALVDLLLDAAGLRGRQTKAVTPVPGQTPKVRAVAVDEEGRTWCSQCDQRVSLERAARCGSQFCKIKVAA